MRYAKSEWGLKLKMFTQRYGVTIKQVAGGAGVRYSTLLQVIIGKTPGYDIVPKVDAYMAEYAAKTDPTINKNLTPFEEVRPCDPQSPEGILR